ncbi:MAG: sensor histidine kinase [Oscillospiraceae bacterium]
MNTKTQYTEKQLRMGRKRYSKGQIFVRKLIPTFIVCSLIAAIISVFGVSYMSDQLMNFPSGVAQRIIQNGYYDDRGDAYAQLIISEFTTDSECVSLYTAIYDSDRKPLITPKNTVILSYEGEGKSGRQFLEINEANANCTDIIREKYDTKENRENSTYSYYVTHYYSDGKSFIPAEVVVKETEKETTVDKFTLDETIPAGFAEYSADESAPRYIIFCEDNTNEECLRLISNSEELYTYHYDNYRVSVNSVIINDECCTLVDVVLVKTDVLAKWAIMYAVPITVIISLLISLLLARVKYAELSAHYAVEDYRRDMTNKLAHDLKTPLMVISGYAENLENDVNTDKRLHYTASILENVRSMDSIIANVLELSKLEDGSFKATATEFDAAALARDIAANYDGELEKNGLKLTVSGTAPFTADKSLMASVLDNLIGNAVKYTDKSGSIAVECQQGRITVTNDCSTADKLDVKALAEPFTKGDNSRSGKGSGLGLSIAAEASRRMGLSLELKAENGKFTATVTRK